MLSHIVLRLTVITGVWQLALGGPPFLESAHSSPVKKNYINIWRFPFVLRILLVCQDYDHLGWISGQLQSLLRHWWLHSLLSLLIHILWFFGSLGPLGSNGASESCQQGERAIPVSFLFKWQDWLWSWPKIASSPLQVKGFCQILVAETQRLL